MPHTEGQKAELKEEFGRRRRRQLLLIVPVIVLGFSFAWAKDQETVLGMPAQTFGIVAFALILAAVVFSFVSWRCPACKGYLGKGISPKFCAKCGAELS